MMWFDRRVATSISRPASVKTTSAQSATVPTAPKSMPLPGVKSVPDSMSAMPSWPLACSPSSACCLVIPSGICRPTIPAKTRSVACPRIFGPITVQTTLPKTAATMPHSLARSCAICRSSRLPEPLKSRDR